MKKVLSFVLAAMAVASFAAAQAQAPADPLTNGTKAPYNGVKNYLLKAAEQVPENLYDYKPTPEVRTFAQQFAHVAESNYVFCSAALGEKPPIEEGAIEKKLTAKADLVKALGESFAYCDKAFAGLNDANAASTVSFFGRPMAKLPILAWNTAHNYDHYGNVVTYLRLNKMVPPSSQPRQPEKK